MNSVDISIIIPCFNSEDTILETMESVDRQSVKNWECIIVDDGSCDDSRDIIRTFISNRPRFTLCKRSRLPKGVSTCRNIGLEKAIGRWVIFLDSDDLLDGRCLERRSAVIKEDPDKDLYVFQMANFKRAMGDIPGSINRFPEDPDGNYLDMFLRHNLPWSVTCPTWRLSFLNSIGGFDESLQRLEDPELHIRALLNTTLVSVDRAGPIDCYRRLRPKGEHRPHYHHHCMEGFTQLIRVVDHQLRERSLPPAYQGHKEALDKTVQVALDFLFNHRGIIRATQKYNFLFMIRCRNYISLLEFCQLLAAFSLPRGLRSLITRSGLPALIKRIVKWFNLKRTSYNER